MSDERRVHIIAASYQHFAYWCRVAGFTPHDPRVIYVQSAIQLMGIDDASVITYGPWRDRRDWQEIDHHLTILLRTNRAFEPVHQEQPRRPSFLR